MAQAGGAKKVGAELEPQGDELQDESLDAPDLVKLQFTVDRDTVANLKESKRLHSDPSLVQSFRRAAALTAFVDKKRKEGYEVLLKRGDEVYKIFLP